MASQNVRTDQSPKECSDIESINRNAKNKAERRLALKWCLANRWPNADIGRLERVDSETWHGWVMWDWKRAE